jgi:hypothetical protein
MTDIEVTETAQADTTSEAFPEGMLANPTRVRI